MMVDFLYFAQSKVSINDIRLDTWDEVGVNLPTSFSISSRGGSFSDTLSVT